MGDRWSEKRDRFIPALDWQPFYTPGMVQQNPCPERTLRTLQLLFCEDPHASFLTALTAWGT